MFELLSEFQMQSRLVGGMARTCGFHSNFHLDDGLAWAPDAGSPSHWSPNWLSFVVSFLMIGLPPFQMGVRPPWDHHPRPLVQQLAPVRLVSRCHRADSAMTLTRTSISHSPSLINLRACHRPLPHLVRLFHLFVLVPPSCLAFRLLR